MRRGTNSASSWALVAESEERTGEDAWSIPVDLSRKLKIVNILSSILLYLKIFLSQLHSKLLGSASDLLFVGIVSFLDTSILDSESLKVFLATSTSGSAADSLGSPVYGSDLGGGT